MKPRNRSEHVHRAFSHISNRFELCKSVAKATRLLHHNNRRLADSMNLALAMTRKVAR
jgi:hypothetical protein